MKPKDVVGEPILGYVKPKQMQQQQVIKKNVANNADADGAAWDGAEPAPEDVSYAYGAVDEAQ